MTTATPVHRYAGSYPVDGYEGCFCVLPDCECETGHGAAVEARIKAIAGRIKSAIPQPSEDEIVRAAITVILVALGSIIALAAMATMAMGW